MLVEAVEAECARRELGRARMILGSRNRCERGYNFPSTGPGPPPRLGARSRAERHALRNPGDAAVEQLGGSRPSPASSGLYTSPILAPVPYPSEVGDRQS